jgi:hypothetical protein
MKIGIMIPVIALFFACAFTHGQVEQVISDFPIKCGTPPEGGERPFVGTFEFETLPEPLQVTGVNFELRATDIKFPHIMDNDWLLRLHYLDNVVRVLSDTIFSWSGPHNPGDIFTGRIDFIPLRRPIRNNHILTQNRHQAWYW